MSNSLLGRMNFQVKMGFYDGGASHATFVVAVTNCFFSRLVVRHWRFTIGKSVSAINRLPLRDRSYVQSSNLLLLLFIAEAVDDGHSTVLSPFHRTDSEHAHHVTARQVANRNNRVTDSSAPASQELERTASSDVSPLV